MKRAIPFIAALAGAVVFRLRGFGLKGIWRTVCRVTFAAPYVVFAWVQTESWWIVLVSAVMTYIGVILGWGSYYTLWKRDGFNGDNEKLRYVLVPLANLVGTEHWSYRLTGMTVRGLVLTVSVGLLTKNIPLALSGLILPAAYAVGHITPLPLPKVAKANSTQWGEIYAGALLWGSLAAVWVYGL